MSVLNSAVDPRATSSGRTGRRCWSASPSWTRRWRQARGGGGEKYVERHHARGKLLARERIELLLDRGLAVPGARRRWPAWGTDFPVGARAW